MLSIVVALSILAVVGAVAQSVYWYQNTRNSWMSFQVAVLSVVVSVFVWFSTFILISLIVSTATGSIPGAALGTPMFVLAFAAVHWVLHAMVRASKPA